VQEVSDAQGTGEHAAVRVEDSEAVLLVEDERGILELLRKALVRITGSGHSDTA
jgi:hypothetical protein